MPRRNSEELLSLFKENWPDGYSPSEEVMLRLYHTALRHTEELQKFLAQFELSTAEFVTLRVLRREPEPHVMTPTMLYETLVMSPGGMTKILKQLESKGWIERRADDRDKRRSLVELTDAGRVKISRVQRAVRDYDTRLLAATLADREQAELAKLLGRMLVALEPRTSAVAALARPEEADISLASPAV
jgi:DNA-binding MarR family transcriptional regulator